MERNEVRPPVSFVVSHVYTMWKNRISTCAMFPGFYCSMDMPRIIRVGTRAYVIRIAAVSPEHVPVCITLKIALAENDMVLVLTSKLK